MPRIIDNGSWSQQTRTGVGDVLGAGISGKPCPYCMKFLLWKRMQRSVKLFCQAPCPYQITVGINQLPEEEKFDYLTDKQRKSKRLNHNKKYDYGRKV